MKRLPVLLTALFLAITLARVAGFTSQYMAAGAMGWVYSIALGVAVYASAYWTRNATTRKAAIVALVFFVAIDCYFNLAHVLLSADRSQTLTAIGAVLYGLFPTLATALLGWLQTSVNKLPPGSHPVRMGEHISEWIASKFALPAQTSDEKISVKGENVPDPVIKYFCKHPGCNYVRNSQNAINAHAKIHSNGHEKVKA